MLSIYKRGQGLWVRGFAATALLALGIYGAVQTSNWLIDYQTWKTVPLLGRQIPYPPLGVWLPTLIFAVFAAGVIYLTNRPKPAELLIETEVEMRKVTWPTVPEVFGATTVVIVVVLLLGIWLAFLDVVMSKTILKWLGLSAGG